MELDWYPSTDDAFRSSYDSRISVNEYVMRISAAAKNLGGPRAGAGGVPVGTGSVERADRDAPEFYGPHKTLYNRFVRWSRMGVFDRIFANLAAKSWPPERLMIDSTHLKAHRTAASLQKGGYTPPYRPHEGRVELQAAYGL